MKKRFTFIAATVLCISLLCSCGKGGTNAETAEYIEKMNNFFESVKTLDTQINALDPQSEDSLAELFGYLKDLEEQYKYLSTIDAPESYNATESLADEAYQYMTQANQYFAASFEDNTYNEYTYAAGIECYNRVNKRLQYIISIINGEPISDDNVTVE